jgi:RNA polymerase sigma factor (sigma-70 family)
VTESSELRLARLVERLRRGDDDDRHALLCCAHSRLHRLAVALYKGFPALRDRHDADSVLHTAWPRLLKALESTSPATAADFFRLAAHKIRQTLLDLNERQRTRDRRERAEGAVDALSPEALAQSSNDPRRLATLSEVHRLISELPSEEQTVFHLHYYAGLSQVDIAFLLGKTPRQVSYLWVGAAGRLAGRLGGTRDI